MEIAFYKSDTGKVYVRDFIYSLEPVTRGKVLDTFKRVLETPYQELIKSRTIKIIKKKLCEIRVLTSRGGYRFLYVVYEGKMVLLESFKKTTQKTPKKHIETALSRYGDLLINKRYEN